MKPPFKTKHQRWGFFLFFLIALYALAIILIVPQFIKNPINQQLKKFDLEADYRQLRINPFTLNIHIKKLHLESRQQLLLNAAEVTLDWQLLPLLNKTFNLDNLTLQDADVYIEFNQQNKLIKPQFPQTTSVEPSADASSKWRFEMGQISIKDTNIHLKKGDQSYVIKQLNASHHPGFGENNQPIDISLRTDPEGQLTVTGEQPNENGGWQLDWELHKWPLKGLSDWLLTSEQAITAEGAISAQGQFTWLTDSQPNVDIQQLNATISQAQYSHLSVRDLKLSAEELDLDFENKQITLADFTSSAAYWQLAGEPYQAITTLLEPLSDSEETEQPWQWQLDQIEINNWQLQTERAIKSKIGTEKDNDLQVFTLKHVKWPKESPHAFTAELIAPESKPLWVTAEIKQNPLSLTGTMVTERFNVSAFNPFISAISGWQLQQAELAVNSDFCYLKGQLNVSGPWSTPRLIVANESQLIEIEQLELAEMHLDFDHKQFYLNKLTAAQGSGAEIINSSNRLVENTEKNAEPSEDSLETESSEAFWQVLIGRPKQLNCLTEPTGSQ